MALSRLRFQLAAWFALALLIGLGAADVAIFVYLRRGADHELTARVRAAAQGLALAVQRELVETPGDLATATREAIAEWPEDGTLFVTFDSLGRHVATRADSAILRAFPPLVRLPQDAAARDTVLAGVILRLSAVDASGPPRFLVAAAMSTAGLRAANRRVGVLLLASAPLIILLALGAGYVLARRALRPLRRMTDEIAGLDPAALGKRLVVRSRPDELDTLAAQFNALFERLAAARARNQRFLAQAAHQLRTPLTVVRGEADLGQKQPRTVAEHEAVLRRIALAAEQMNHRVNDLFLLAQAEAGDRPALTDEVDVDGLVLECVDLMRGRAAGLGCQLELVAMDPAEIRGNESLIREGVMELLENACRHGDRSRPIGVATHNEPGRARIEVRSSGAPVAARPSAALPGDRTALGLSIVRWIAEVHGGTLEYRHDAGANTFTLVLSGGRPPLSS